MVVVKRSLHQRGKIPIKALMLTAGKSALSCAVVNSYFYKVKQVQKKKSRITSFLTLIFSSMVIQAE